MPHIIIHADKPDAAIEVLQVKAHIKLNSEIFKSPRGKKMVQEIADKLSKVVTEYFEEYSEDILSNHEHNLYKHPEERYIKIKLGEQW